MAPYTELELLEIWTNIQHRLFRHEGHLHWTGARESWSEEPRAKFRGHHVSIRTLLWLRHGNTRPPKGSRLSSTCGDTECLDPVHNAVRFGRRPTCQTAAPTVSRSCLRCSRSFKAHKGEWFCQELCKARVRAEETLIEAPNFSARDRAKLDQYIQKRRAGGK